MPSSPKALLLSARNSMTLGRLPGLLAAGGFDVVVMGNPSAPAARSRHARRVIRVDGGPSALMDAAIRLVGEHPHDWRLIIPGEDALMMEIKRRPPQDLPPPLLPVRADCLEVLVSKVGFSRLADAAGIPVPRWRAVGNVDEALEAAAAIGYPVIIKPDEGQAGRDLFKASSPEDLRGNWGKRTERQIVQEFVEGEPGLVEMLYDHGRLVCWAESRKVRTLLGPFGISTCRGFTRFPGVHAHLVELGQRTGFHGFCGADLIRRSDGTVAYVEFNTRATSGYVPAQMAGVPFVAAVRSLARGETREFPPPTRKVEVPFFPEDIVRAAYSDPWHLFVRRCLHPRLLRTVPWTDPGLLRSNLGRVYQGLKARRDAP